MGNFLSLKLESYESFESYEEQATKRSLVYRDSEHRKHHESLKPTGNWCESALVTLTTRPGAPVYTAGWFLKVWRRVLPRYDKKRRGETVPYHITANRGTSGREQASAHVIFENEPFPDLSVLQELWEKETGGEFEITTAGHRASLYQSKNATEPGAVEEDFRCKMKLEPENRATPRLPSARKKRRAASDAAWLAHNDRPRNRVPIETGETVDRIPDGNGADGSDGNIGGADAGDTGPPVSGNQSAAAAGVQPRAPLALGRHKLVGLRQEKLDVREWRHGLYPRTVFVRAFRDETGREYLWNGTSAVPVNIRGYQHAGRYPLLPGTPLTFAATIREIWPDGTVIISRPYIRLDRQPEATRRAYAREYGVALQELGLEPQ